MVLLRLIGLCQRDAAELTAVDTDLQQASESRNDALELHVFAAARAGAAGLLVHMPSMTERAPAALTLINRANADGGKSPGFWEAEALPQALRGCIPGQRRRGGNEASVFSGAVRSWPRRIVSRENPVFAFAKITKIKRLPGTNARFP